MARAASLLTEFLGFCFYLHRRGGVLGCGPEALRSQSAELRELEAVKRCNSEVVAEFSRRPLGRGASGRGWAQRLWGCAEPWHRILLELAGSGQSELQSPFCGFPLTFASLSLLRDRDKARTPPGVPPQ